MQLTLYRTLWIHTLLIVGMGGYWVTHRRVPDKTAPVKHVRMPTQAELLEIVRLSHELRYSYHGRDPVNLDRRYRALIVLQLRYMPPEHPEVVFNREGLAEVLRRSGRCLEAAEQYGILLNIYQRVMGLDAPDTMTCQKNLSDMLREANEPEKAEEILRQLSRKLSVDLGERHPEVMKLRTEIADQMMLQSKFQEAESELGAVLEIQRKKQESNHVIPAQTMCKLVLCLVAQGKVKEASAYDQEIEQLKIEAQREDPKFADRMAMLRIDIEAAQNRQRVK